MDNDKRARGPDRLGGAQPPSSGGYGDIDRSAQRVGESDAPDVKQQEPRALEGLSGMGPGAAVRPDDQDDRLDEQSERARVQPQQGDETAPPIENPDDEVDPD